MKTFYIQWTLSIYTLIMKKNYIFLIFNLFVSTLIEAKELNCSHYLHIDAHNTEVTILQWQENFKLSLGESENELREKLAKNKTKAAEILSMIKRGEKALAKLELEKTLNRSLRPIDVVDDLIAKFAASATKEKELIKLKKDKYSEMSLKLV
ncbi:MAG: hypothetical protein K2Q18_14870, partial [Bdellovibrionales bacterium]|nr:hypothetical protein [Bdellovibrionales bacterium]